MRREFAIAAVVIPVVMLALAPYYPGILWLFVIVAPLLTIGIIDFFQTKHTIRRNFPIVGNFRYLFESIRPEINQYFVESNIDGRPFSREERAVVYQRAKGVLDTLPFGTQRDVYAVGYEWLNHSLLPSHIEDRDLRIVVGGPECANPYNCSIFNISAMSYGSLSKNAVLALSGGAKDGGFAHNTGEGGISPYHLKPGGDLIWQIGTGYFGCRAADGTFDEEKFRQNASRDSVRMIELKLSQGAKPGHGGILPAKKVNAEIAEIRGVPIGEDVLSPAAHSSFSTPVELLQFIGRLRELAEGKPVGFKLCVGKRREFFAICKAIEKTGITPDFIVIDGGEGGTGAAPLEFSNNLGTPGVEGLILAHNALVGFGVRDRVKVFATGKVTSAFGVVKRLALGADAVYSARGMMLALGCIQALRCNSNHCPTGIATQNQSLVSGLVVPHKRERIHRFHEETITAVVELLEAMGLQHSEELQPWHILRRISPTESRHYGELFDYLNTGELLKAELPEDYRRAMNAATAESFRHIADCQ
jgi:glutamate synthase domain-containing protein 2